MTRSWADHVRNYSESLGVYFPGGINSGDVRLWSINLVHAGPTVAVRLDLPTFTQHPRDAWIAAGCDRMQCRIDFLDAASIELRKWVGVGGASLVIQSMPEKRLHVRFQGKNVEVEFTCSDSLLVNHVGAYAAARGPHVQQFASVVDRHRLKDELPDATDRRFYG